jgi:polysaccharide pyruvyl transferase WcaK-like protein
VYDSDVEIVGLTLNPVDTKKRHRIEAYSICGFTKPGYLVDQGTQAGNREIPTTQEVSTEVAGDIRESETVSATIEWFRNILKRTPGMRWLVHEGQESIRILDRIIDEMKHLWWSFRLLRRTDMLVVAGGGQLDDFWGGPWGHPYVLFRWSMLSKLSNTKFVILSVGTGQLGSSLSRRFIRKTLGAAMYRSYRDQGSKDMIAFANVSRTDPVVPDLAFGYPVASENSQINPQAIGLSPMIYKGPVGWPDTDEKIYGEYINRMAELISELFIRGFTVTLFPSVQSDKRAIDAILNVLEPEVGKKVLRPTVRTVEDLFQTLMSVDLSIASRLHGVLLSYKARRPVVALSYERKVDTLMHEFGSGKFCFSIDAFSAKEVIEAIDALSADVPDMQRRNDTILAASAQAVEDQFKEILRVADASRTVNSTA